MSPPWPQSLAGRLIIWLMLVLTLALILALALYRLSNERLLARVAQEDAVTRITMVSRILEQSGANKWQQTLHAATSDDFRFSFLEGGIPKIKNHTDHDDDHARSAPFFKGKTDTDDDMVLQKFAVLIPDETHPDNKNKNKTIWFIERQLTDNDRLSPLEITKIQNAKRQTLTVKIDDKRLQPDNPFFQKNGFPSNQKALQDWMIQAVEKKNALRNHLKTRTNTVDLAVELENGRWLKGAFKPKTQPFWSWDGAIFLGILAIAIGGVIILVVRTETRPMQRLAQAAEALGRGEHLPPLDEHGPREIRLAVEAFNLMRARLGSFMQDRTRMLAAMSHDLRTPLTTLRLRAEMIEEPEAREKLIETIEEMHRITEASLSFAREEDSTEPTEDIDLTALVSGLCDEAQAMGKEAAMASNTPAMNARVRPAALRRALRNLIDNAVRYGHGAQVRFCRNATETRIMIDDDGPGIKEDRLDDVFSPFVRLETSRNVETGGAGLGLSIARTIARSHGGDVVLQNRKSGGLRAILSLPNKANTAP